MSDEELSLRHRRASEAAAGAPSAATRAAIRREAETQAMNRRATTGAPPAANDARWSMRAVATVAVVAIAAGLWWQMRPELSQQLQRGQMEAEAPVALSSAPRVDLPMPPPPLPSAPQLPSRSAPATRPAASAPAPPPAPAGASRLAADAVSEAAPAGVVAMDAAVPAARQQQPAAANVSAELRALARSEHAALSEPAAPSEPAAFRESAALSAAIARRLPAAWNSAAPVEGLWVLLDSAGTVVDAGQQISDQPVPGVVAGSVLLRNARGLMLQVVVRRAAARP